MNFCKKIFWHMLLAALLLSATAAAQEKPSGNWPGFRGEDAMGVADGHPLASEWSVESGDGIAWKADVPGLGHASPVIWDDTVFLVTAVSGKADPYLKVGLYGNIDPVDDPTVHKFLLVAIDKNSGKHRWERTLHEGVPKIKRHTKASHANSSPATDGTYIVVFLGSEGLYCYTMDGELVWKRDLGLLDSGYFRVREAQWGFASSPIIFNGKVIVQCDVQEGSFIAAFDLKTGEPVWRTAREEVPTWSTPAIVPYRDGHQVVANGWKHIGGYHPETGAELWRLTGGGDIPVPTPIFGHGLLFITNAHGRMSPIYAIRPDAAGDISLAEGASKNDAIAWSIARGGAYMQTPILYNGYLYVCRDNGVLSCYKPETGERLFQKRLAGGRSGFTASAVAGDGKLYYTGEYGDVYVVKAGPEGEVLAKNSLGEVSMATPGISEGTLFFRTRNALIAVRE